MREAEGGYPALCGRYLRCVTSEHPVDEALLVATEHQARRVLDAQGLEPTYNAGIEFIGVCMGGMEVHTPDGFLSLVPTALYQVWGALTDEVDAPGRGTPAQDAAALAHMKRATSEWLDVSRSPDRRSEYLDRWVYEECGYERPAE